MKIRPLIAVGIWLFEKTGESGVRNFLDGKVPPLSLYPLGFLYSLGRTISTTRLVVLTVVPRFAPQLQVTATSSQSSLCCQCSLKATIPQSSFEYAMLEDNYVFIDLHFTAST
jgi:hypothetical protein